MSVFSEYVSRRSIRSLAVLLSALVVVPALLVVLVLLLRAFHEKRSDVAEAAMRLAQICALKHEDAVNQAHALMETVTNLPGLMGRDVRELRSFFVGIIEDGPQYAYLTLARPDGHLFASSASTDTSLDFSDRDQFQLALKTGKFSVGRVIVSRTTGLPVLPFGAPVKEASGTVSGVLLLGLRIEVYERYFTALNPPEGTRFLLFDEQGTRLFRHPRRDVSPVGEKLIPRVWEAISAAASTSGEFTLPDQTGLSVSYAFVRPHFRQGGIADVGLLVGLPSPGFAADMLPVLAWTFAVLGLLFVASVAVGRAVSRRIVSAGLVALEERAAGIVRDREFLPVEFTPGCLEVTGLAESFNRLIEYLRKDRAARDAAERSLGSAMVRFQTILETASDGIHILDQDGDLVECSDSFLQMLGYGEEEVRGLNVRDWDAKIPAAELGAAIAGLIRAPATFETLHRRKDGRILDVEVNAKGVELDGRQYLYASARDITWRKKAELELRESEARWQFALEGAGDGVWDWNAKTGKVYFSRTWKAMLGYGEDEIGDGLEEWDSRVHPDDKAMVDASIQAHFDGIVECYVSEHRVRCKDGGYKWILDRGMVISRDEDGKPLRVIGTHADISALKAMEQRIRESEQWYRAFFEGGDSVKLIINPETGAIVECNRKAETFYGHPPGVLAGMAVSDLDPRPAQEVRADLDRAAGSEQSHFELRHRLAGGEVREVDVYASPVRHAEQTLVLSHVFDVTERKRLEEVRNDVERIVRHDLKSPLSGLVNIPLLLVGDNLTEGQRRLCRMMSTAARKVLIQINSSLEMYKIETGTYAFAPAPCHPLPLVRENAEMLTLTMGREPGSVEIRSTLPEDAAVLTDSRLLDIVVVNLLQNALEAGDDGMRVRVDLRLDGRELALAFSNALPVAPEVRDRFFEKFATAGKTGGTGLGTYSAAIMTRAMGGRIDMETSDEAGTTVTVRLPL